MHAKSLQLCLVLWPHGPRPPGPSVHGPHGPEAARHLCAQSPWTGGRQAPLCMAPMDRGRQAPLCTATLQARILGWAAVPSSVLVVSPPNSQASVSPSQALSLAPAVPVWSLGSEERRAPPPESHHPWPPLQPLRSPCNLTSISSASQNQQQRPQRSFCLPWLCKPASPARSHWKGK